MAVPRDAEVAVKPKNQSGTQDKNKWKRNWAASESFWTKTVNKPKAVEIWKESSDTSQHTAVLKSIARGPLGSAECEKEVLVLKN